MKKQLLQNQQYLRPLQKYIKLFTFDSSTGVSYSIDGSSSIVTSTLTEIGNALYLEDKEWLYVDDIVQLFPPERYLVSPFNATEAF